MLTKLHLVVNLKPIVKTMPAERRIGCIKTHRKCETDLKFRKWFLKVCSCLESRCNYCNMWSINLIKDQHTHLLGHFNWRKRNFLAVCPELCRNRKRQLHYHKPLSRYYIYWPAVHCVEVRDALILFEYAFCIWFVINRILVPSV